MSRKSGNDGRGKEAQRTPIGNSLVRFIDEDTATDAAKATADPTFGKDGVAKVAVANVSFRTMAVQNNGAVIIAGQGLGDVRILRYAP